MGIHRFQHHRYISLLVLIWWLFVGNQNFSVHGSRPENNNNNNQRKKQAVVFGTENGYDVGGTDPLCWESRLYSTEFTTSENATAPEEDSIETLNQELFNSEDPDVQLLPACPNGTMISVTPLDLDASILPSDQSNNLLYTEQSYTFRLNIQLNMNNVIATHNWTTPPDGFFFIHCRLHLCDTSQQGFCNPLDDTRESDAAMTRADTDHMEEGRSLPPMIASDNKWEYTEGTPLKGLTDGVDRSKIYSRWIKWKLRESDEDPEIYKTEVDMSLWLPKNTNPGVYFFIGHVVVDFKAEDDANVTRRIDITQTIPGNVVQVQAEPQILQASKSSKIWLGVAISVVGCYAIFCFGFIVWHRAHPVMQLSQGILLAAVAFFCFLIALFSFTFLPIYDSFCYMNGPLVSLPITAVGATLLGRVWRIYSTLNVANSLGRFQSNKNKVEEWFVQILDCLSGSQSFCNACQGGTADAKRTSFRRTVTTLQTARLIFMLTVPQMVLQIVSSIVAEGGLDIEVTSDGSVGRVVCTEVSWVRISTTCISAFVYFLAVSMAWISRDLPSAFNEKDQIFNAATIGTILVVGAIVLGQITDQPTTSPDVAVFLDSCCALGIAGSVLYLIIHPKIVRVSSGDKVVVSNLLGSKFIYHVEPGENSYSGLVQSGNSSQERSNTLHESSLRTSNGTEQKIQLRKDQPMPSHIERKILDVQSMLRNITEHFGDGRSLTKEEWQLMCEEVSLLKMNLDQVEFEDRSQEVRLHEF